MLKLLKNDDEIYKEDKFGGTGETSSEIDRFIPLKDLNFAKGDMAMLKKSLWAKSKYASCRIPNISNPTILQLGTIPKNNIT